MQEGNGGASFGLTLLLLRGWYNIHGRGRQKEICGDINVTGQVMLSRGGPCFFLRGRRDGESGQEV